MAAERGHACHDEGDGCGNDEIADYLVGDSTWAHAWMMVAAAVVVAVGVVVGVV